MEVEPFSNAGPAETVQRFTLKILSKNEEFTMVLFSLSMRMIFGRILSCLLGSLTQECSLVKIIGKNVITTVKKN